MSVQRILDANANRAREALRVMEEAARFLLDDVALTRDLKTLRHELAIALRSMPDLELNRDTPGDVGTSLTTEAESKREAARDVVIAAGKRLSEALRVLEEYGKTIDASFAHDIEAIRYRAYDLELQLQRRLPASSARQWRLCVLLTEALCARPWDEVLQRVIEGGADCIQVREKGMPGGDLLQRVRQVIDVCRPHDVSVIVNDRLDVALTAGADGVHLGQDDLPIVEARRLAGRSLMIGASTHDVDEAHAAIEAGADYCGVGMMFPSAVKPELRAAGVAYARDFVRRFPRVAHLAIGGITPGNAGELATAGVRGVAVSSAVCAAEDPGAVVAKLRDALGG